MLCNKKLLSTDMKENDDCQGTQCPSQREGHSPWWGCPSSAINPMFWGWRPALATAALQSTLQSEGMGHITGHRGRAFGDGTKLIMGFLEEEAKVGKRRNQGDQLHFWLRALPSGCMCVWRSVWGRQRGLSVCVVCVSGTGGPQPQMLVCPGASNWGDWDPGVRKPRVWARELLQGSTLCMHTCVFLLTEIQPKRGRGWGHLHLHLCECWAWLCWSVS